MAEVHSWLSKGVEFTEEELEERGWNSAYDLQTWDLFSGGGIPSMEPLSIKDVTTEKMDSCASGSNAKTWKEIVEQTRGFYEEVLKVNV